jgi:hypothetical protein
VILIIMAISLLVGRCDLSFASANIDFARVAASYLYNVEKMGITVIFEFSNTFTLMT